MISIRNLLDPELVARHGVICFDDNSFSNMWHFIVNCVLLPWNLYYNSHFEKRSESAVKSQSKSDTKTITCLIFRNYLLASQYSIKIKWNFKHTVQKPFWKLNLTKDACYIFGFGCNYFFLYKFIRHDYRLSWAGTLSSAPTLWNKTQIQVEDSDTSVQ